MRFQTTQAPIFVFAFSSIGALSFLLFAGCSKTESPPPALPQSSPLSMTSADAAEMLEGAWRGKMVVNETVAKEKLDAAQLDSLRGMKMQMSFEADGALHLEGRTNGTSYKDEARWEFQSAHQVPESNQRKITIRSTGSDGKVKNVDMIFTSDDSFRMPLSTEVADLGAMEFKRLR